MTGDLQQGSGDKSQQSWGSWLTQADVNQARGQALMTGKDDKPLLILDKAGDGRVAVLTSDNIWMWSKGIGGGFFGLVGSGCLKGGKVFLSDVDVAYFGAVADTFNDAFLFGDLVG